MAAESVVASGSGITTEQAMEALAFQGRADEVIEAIEGALGDRRATFGFTGQAVRIVWGSGS